MKKPDLINIKNIIKAFFTKKGVRKGTNDLLAVVLVFAILAVVNYIFSNHQFKKDFTRAKLNSLSEQSINVTKKLKEDVNFIAFIKTTDAFAFRKVIDMYSYYNDKIKYEIVDPNKEPIKTRNYNISKYGTIILISGSGNETRIEDMNIAEESITNALIKISRKEKKIIYFTEGHGEKGMDTAQSDGFSEFKKLLEGQSYTVSSLSLVSMDTIPADAKAVVLAGPTKAFFGKEIDLLNTYFERGGSILVLSDPSSPKQPVKPNENVGKLLNPKGIILNDDLIVDPMSRLFGVGEAMSVVQTYDKANKITADFNAMTVYPFAQSLNIEKVDREKYDVSELCKTMPTSWGEVSSKQGEIEYNEGKDHKGPLTVAAIMSSKGENKKGTIAVFGNSVFAANQFINHAGNGDLIMNTISYLVKDEDLISIRPKSDEKGVFTMPSGGINFVAMASVWMLPLLLLSAGVVFWYRRRKL
jgi:ABC-type uncharacterized transport system involved in gliding motility auxiliary subunit